MDSPDRASNDHPVLEGAPNEICAPLKEGIPTRGPSNANKIGEGAPLRVTIALMLPPRPADAEASRKMSPNQVLLSTYVPPQERIHPPMGMVTLDLEGAQEIIHCWSPFNQEKPPVAHMCDLYTNYFQVPVAARVEQYSIPFPIYMNKEASQSVAEDGMLICNHDFY